MRAAANMDDLVIRRGVGGPIAAAIGLVVLLSSAILAVQNLLNPIAVIWSLVWLGLVGSALVFKIREAGLARFCEQILGALSVRQFLQVDVHGGDGKTLSVGFQLFGLRGVEHQIRAENLVRVTWHSGQASDMAGRDVGDWSVFLWYRHGDSTLEAKQKKWRHMRPEQTVVVLGSARQKTVTQALGNQIVQFLRDSGVSVETAGTEPPPNSALQPTPTRAT